MTMQSVAQDLVSFRDGDMLIRFPRFGLDEYDLFLKTKKLPESRIEYDWESDTYTLTAPERFARILGIEGVSSERALLAMPDLMFRYQRWVVETAVKAKRYAIFAECGLGKTFMFLEFARQVAHTTGGRVLIFSPLNIIPGTIAQARTFYGDSLSVEWIRDRETLETWCKGTEPAIGITNYDKMIPGELHALRYLAGVVCDESSIMSHMGGGKIKWNIRHSTKGVEYKLSCTATPAPNEAMEYASQAGWLEKLRNENEIIWTYFKRDKNGNWFLNPYAIDQFYRFMSSWCIFLRDPAVFGWEDINQSIPDPVFHEHVIQMTEEQAKAMQKQSFEAGGGLFGLHAMGIVTRNKLSQIAKGFVYHKDDAGKKARKATRIKSLKPAFVAELARKEVATGRQVLIWTVFDEESEIIEEALADAPFKLATLHGKHKESQRAKTLESFVSGETAALISKGELLGYGQNFQQCRAMIFSGMTDSYEEFHQEIRRAVRFGQTDAVQIHLPYIPDLEGKILENVNRKKAQFEHDAAMQQRYFLNALRGAV